MDEKNLHGYQWTGVDFIKDKTHCALLLEMGLGKTVTSLTAIKILMYDELEISRTLIIAPKRVAEHVWSSEVKKWDHLKHLKISVISGTEKQRKAALAVKADIYTIGRDNVAWLAGLYGGGALPFDMCVIDELSSFKNSDSVRFKSLKKVQPSFKRVVGLTGTPAPNSMLDLWSQIYLLDRGERLGKYVTHYRQDYFRPDKRNGDIVYSYKLSEENQQKIYDKIGDICMSMKARDYLELPPRIDNIVEVHLDQETLEAYKNFEKEKVLELLSTTEGNEITALNAAGLSNKLLQFANGAVYDSDRDVHEVHDEKIKALVEIVETSQSPVLVAWVYQHDRDRISKALKKFKVRQLKTNQDIDDWNAGEIDVLTMHPASGGHGLNLQAGGNVIVWFGNTWSLELEQQFNARLDRQGQTKSVVVNKLVTVGTLDMDVIKAQTNKAEGQESLMQAVKARIKPYMQGHKKT